MRDALGAAIARLAQDQSLSEAESASAFNVIMTGAGTPARIAALLVGLRVKGETAAEVIGAARALRAAMVRVEVPDAPGLVDTCGTGGGSVGTFNVSTAAAFVAAGAGVRIAKHGNRSFTSKCGSADVLEALGVVLEAPPERLPQILEEAGIVFMFAPAMHPAMRFVGPVRRELGIPTVMNILGPLANPASAGRQVIGVADPARLPLMAAALAGLGSVHALVVHGAPGLDEFSPLGRSVVHEVRDGTLREWTVDPASFGLASDRADELLGGDPPANAALIEAVLSGGGPVAARSAVTLNAAAAIYVGGLAPDLAAGVQAARESVASGRAQRALQRLRAATASAA